MKCLQCDGKGCRHCHQRGRWLVTDVVKCAKRDTGLDVERMLDAALWAEKGHLPLAGGMLDQTLCFEQATRLIWYLNNEMQAEEIKRWRRRN